MSLESQYLQRTRVGYQALNRAFVGGANRLDRRLSLLSNVRGRQVEHNVLVHLHQVDVLDEAPVLVVECLCEWRVFDVQNVVVETDGAGAALPSNVRGIAAHLAA